jgi:hypothetical protein
MKGNVCDFEWVDPRVKSVACSWFKKSPAVDAVECNTQRTEANLKTSWLAELTSSLEVVLGIPLRYRMQPSGADVLSSHARTTGTSNKALILLSQTESNYSFFAWSRLTMIETFPVLQSSNTRL